MGRKGKRFFGTENEPDEEEINLLKKQRKSIPGFLKTPKIPKWIYRVVIILLITVVALSAWFNRENLTPQNVSDWLNTCMVGIGAGDGYPVTIVGNSVACGNFLSEGKNAVTVSDISFNIWNSSGKPIVSRQHSFNQPVLKQAGEKFLIYDLSGTGYQVGTPAKNLIKTTAKQKISVGTICSSGKFALITQPGDYASCLTVYCSDGSEQYRYSFRNTYITSVCLNSSGTNGVVAGVAAQNGVFRSVVYFFDFNNKTPIALCESKNNMIFDLSCLNSGVVCAVGDQKTVFFDLNGKNQKEYSYNGQQLTAYSLKEGRVVLSLSNYSVRGSCYVVELNSSARETTKIQSKHMVKSVSAYGGVISVLSAGEVKAYATVTGKLLSTRKTGGDSCAVAMEDEGAAYVLGVSKIQRITF